MENPTIEPPPELIAPVPPCELVALWQTAASQLRDAPPSDDPLENASRGAGYAALAYCATMLSLWIRHEGNHVMMCMPPALVRLIGVALQFDHKDKEDWKRLAMAARACQGAGAS